MLQYIIYFNQQWVGDHSEEWFRERGPLANAVVEEMRAAGEYVCAGGVDEDLDNAFTADARSGNVEITDGPYVRGEQYIGGLTIVEVADEERAGLGSPDRRGVRLAAGDPTALLRARFGRTRYLELASPA